MAYSDHSGELVCDLLFPRAGFSIGLHGWMGEGRKAVREGSTGPEPGHLTPEVPRGQPPAAQDCASAADAGARAGVAVVLISDRNYLMPTFAAALSADRHTSGAPVPIEVFVLDADQPWLDRIKAAAEGTRITFRTARIPQFEELARHHRDRYLPPVALARLCLDDLLGSEIDRFLYLDGDTMVDGSLCDLLSRAPPPEGVLAARDALAIYFQEVSRFRARDLAYLDGLEVTPERYFNSGVIYASRQAWRTVAPAARAFLAAHPDRCRSSDQSALNHATRGCLSPLPLRYNYQSEHMIALNPPRGGRRPVIWHFTGAPKPWDAAEWPWDDSFSFHCDEAKARLAPFGIAVPRSPEAQMEAGLAHRRRARFRLAWVYPWRRLLRRRRILADL